MYDNILSKTIVTWLATHPLTVDNEEKVNEGIID